MTALKCMHREHAHPECFVVLCHLSYLCYEVCWEIVWNCCRTATIMASGLFSDVLELVKCKVYTTNVIGQCDQLSTEGIVAGLCNRFKVWMTSCILFGIVSESCKSFSGLLHGLWASIFEVMDFILQVTLFIISCWVHMLIGAQRQVKQYSIW